MDDDLQQTKQTIQKTLGKVYPNYLALLRKWFAGQINKDDFDLEARLLFTQKTIHYHNDFFASLLNKCRIKLTQKRSSSPTPTGFRALKKIRRTASAVPSLAGLEKWANADQVRFSLNGDSPISDALPSLAAAESLPAQLSIDQSCSKDGVLPDSNMLHGRLLVTCWQNTIKDLEDETLALINYAVRDALKDLIHACVELRRSHLVYDHRFQHLFGVSCPQVAQKIAAPNVNFRIASDNAELKEYGITSVLVNKPKSKISVDDLVQALRITPKLVPQKSIYNVLMERLLVAAKCDDS